MPRLMTLVLAAVLTLVFLPVMGLTALALICSGTPRVFYSDQRIGQYGRPFRILKFRTMRDPDGTPCAYRVTPLGRVLRKYRLDELPQLFNVFKGDLNLVGFRPPLPHYVDGNPTVYEPLLVDRPGLTGLASIRFHAREDRLLAAARDNDEAAYIHRQICIPAKARLDRLYIRKRSIGLDLWILFRTLVVFLPLIRLITPALSQVRSDQTDQPSPQRAS